MKSPDLVSRPTVVGNPPISNTRLAMLLFLASEVMLFAALISGYVILYAGSNGFAGMKELSAGLTLWSTPIILLSSIALIVAHRGFLQRKRTPYRTGALLAFVAAFLFLVLQWFEWTYLMEGGVLPDSGVNSGMLYILSGAHGLHVLGGLIILAIFCLKAFRGAFTLRNRNFLTVTAIYWHFVTVVWLTLFLMLFVL